MDCGRPGLSRKQLSIFGWTENGAPKIARKSKVTSSGVYSGAPKMGLHMGEKK